ncbi:MAG: heme ABC exporter ATP-binding protein CcmA [Proteobacteria bacterium]|nr:heme ABC exporter ATP-binding protein CcmA [Pseudomonadota bacterium]
MTTKISNIRVEKLTKVFGSVRALAGVSCELKPGEVLAVMGPNGAGKSTLLSILSLTMRPTRGQVLLNGEPAPTADMNLKGRIGLLSHQPLVYPDLTCRENLMLFAHLYGCENPAQAAGSVEEELNILGFSTDRPTRVLSRGQLQRVAMARALISKPDLLLLDEPAAGLDSEAVSRIEQVFEKLIARGGMAVMVTHEPEVASSVATRAIMMHRGKIVSDTQAPSSAEQWRALYIATVKRENS